MLDNITVYHYDAFSDIPNKGNPAGVVLTADNLSDNDMKSIAYKIGFNETTFVQKSNVADIRFRYFTPGHEMNLCGHGTVATLFCLKTRGFLKDRTQVTIETKAGVLNINFIEKDNKLWIKMEQASPAFKEFSGSIEELACSIGLDVKDIDTALPIIYGSTGTWTLLVPIKTLEAFARMKPDNKTFPSILTEIPTCSVHPFSIETIKPYANMHGRHFSSPYSGTVEDPVTGTASGVMGAYYMTYIKSGLSEVELLIEQGQDIDRDGEVLVYVKRDMGKLSVQISGTAVFVGELNINL